MPARVLVVDDDPIVREVLTRYLERDGFGVEVAEDGEAAIDLFGRTKPDLIVLDLMLTPKEFDLLHFLASNPGQVFTRLELLDELWDFAFHGDPSTVTVHIRRLREKIEADPSTPRRIVTVWGSGYRFDP